MRQPARYWIAAGALLCTWLLLQAVGEDRPPWHFHEGRPVAMTPDHAGGSARPGHSPRLEVVT